MATNLWSQTQQKYAQQANTPTVNTPTSTGAYTTNVNTALKGKGIKPEQIGYNPHTNDYSIDGKQFLRANKNYGGAGYTSPNSFMQAWKLYNQQPQQTTPTTNTGTPYTASSTVNGQYNPYSGATGLNGQNPYTTDYDQKLQWLMNYAQNPTAVDPYSTPEYAAYQAQSDRRAHQGIRAAQEALGGAGFGRSTALGERAQGIQNAETEYLNTQMIPQIIAAEQARRQQVFSNMMSSLGLLGGQQNRADNLVQQDINNAVQKGQLLGSFTDPAATALYNSVTGAKRAYADAETHGDRAAMDAARAKADEARTQLQNMGYDTSGYGANKTLETALQGGAPSIRTLGGQAQDLANKQQAYNEKADQRDYKRGVLESDRNYDYQVGRSKAIDAQWKAEFDHRVEQDGIQNALAWANDARAQQEFEDSSAYKWAGLDADLAAANKGASYEGMTANQVVDNVRKNLADETGKIPAGQESAAYLQIINAGLPEDQENQALATIGLTKSQIDALDKQYLTDAGKQ